MICKQFLHHLDVSIPTLSSRAGVRFRRLRVSPHDCPPRPTFQMPGYHLCLRPTSYGPELPKTPSVGLTNLLEGSQYSEKCNTRSSVYYKRLDSRNSQGEGIYRARFGERAWRFHVLPGQAGHPILPRVLPREVPQTQCFWVFMGLY